MQGNIHERGLRQSLDWSLVLYYVLLVLIGWVNIYASTQSAGPDSIFDFDFRAGKQFVWILSGLGLAALILFVIPPRIWQRVSLPIYGAVVLLHHNKCHIFGPLAVHNHAGRNKWIKARMQMQIMREQHWDMDRWIREFGKNYIPERNFEEEEE